MSQGIYPVPFNRLCGFLSPLAWVSFLSRWGSSRSNSVLGEREVFSPVLGVLWSCCRVSPSAPQQHPHHQVVSPQAHCHPCLSWGLQVRCRCDSGYLQLWGWWGWYTAPQTPSLSFHYWPELVAWHWLHGRIRDITEPISVTWRPSAARSLMLLHVLERVLPI